jgi:predicted metal-dependent peptidase
MFDQNLLGTLQATPAQFGAKIKALRDLSKGYEQSLEESKAAIESNSFQNIQPQKSSGDLDDLWERYGGK